MQIKNFNTVLSEIQTHLEDYLQSKGFDTAKNFSCIDPAHKDKNPSCGLMPGKLRAFCHSEGRIFDIFDAFCLIEKKDNHGIGFIIDVVQPLAAQFNIPIEMGEISEEKLFELEVYKAYRDVAEYITQSAYGSNIVPKEIKENRHWLHDVLKETNTGTVKSYVDFGNYLFAKGYSSEFLTEVDLNRLDIFNENNIIFTTHDEYGNPVGFAARNCLWKKGDSTPKYVNQRTTGIKANIYRKGERLYGFHLARKEEGPLYIFEGQGDVLTARQAGLKNCVAIGSTALTTEHITLLKEFNKYNIILCLDGDNAGQDKIAKLLDTRFAGHKEMQVSIVIIPDGEDPDSFIRNNGLEQFNKLARRTAFEWRMNCFTESSDPIDICKSMIPFIVNEPSYLIQEDMAKVLAKVTGYSVNSIKSEVERLQNAQEERKSQERTNVIDKALKSARDNPQDAEIILTEARTQLMELSKKYDDDTMSEQEFLKQVIHQRTNEESKSDKFSGFVLSEELKNFQEALAGEWDKDVLCVFGGKANSGKSAFLSKLSYDIASHEDNDAIAIYHTIDDSREQLLPRFVCIAEGSHKLSINAVRDPNYWAKQIPDLLTKRSTGYDSIEKLIKTGRLIIKDANHGTSLSYVENLIQYYRERYPHRKLIYFLDNFHKLNDYADSKDERVRFKKLSKATKALATTYHIPIMSTMEYTKLAPGTRPSNNNISETVSMEYDSNLIVHLYNDLHELGPQSTIFHNVEAEGKLTRFPRVEMIFGKNKITSFKDSLYFDFYPAASDFVGIERDVIAAQLEAAEKEKKNKENAKGYADPKIGGLY